MDYLSGVGTAPSYTKTKYEGEIESTAYEKNNSFTET